MVKDREGANGAAKYQRFRRGPLRTKINRPADEIARECIEQLWARLPERLRRRESQQ